MKRYSQEETSDLAGAVARQWNRRVRSVRVSGIVLGALLALLGIVLGIFPGASVAVLETMAALLIVLLGAAEIAEFCSLPALLRRGGLLMSGVLNAVMGILLLTSPVEIGIQTFAFLFAFLLLLFGIDLLTLSGTLRYFDVGGRGWVVVLGIVSLAAAVLFLCAPMASAVALNYILAVYLLVCGVTLLVRMLSMRDLEVDMH